MLAWALSLLVIGILLSAFFSGSETGFYRVKRVRLLLDALDGSQIARGLLWLTNNPSLFVATTLIGNNLANYMASISIVLLAGLYFGGESYAVEIVAPILFSPLVFVYGELLPKNLFYYAPNRLLRLGGILFLFFTLLFAPLVATLWVLGRGLQWLVGESPAHVRLTLARKELQQVFDQGHEAGILKPSQRALSQSLFSIAGEPVSTFSTPLARVVSVPIGSSKADVLRLARRHRVSAVPLTDPKSRRIAGYVRAVDLYLSESRQIVDTRPLLEINQSELHSAALVRMQSHKESLARVVDENGKTVGILYAHDLTEPLFRSA